MENEILTLAKAWTENEYFDAKDREELKKLLSRGEASFKEVTERFYQDLEFGTGGLRQILGFGRNRMNKYNVRKATQAMANVALQTSKGETRACVSFDCRNFSNDFAKEVAGVFAANGIKTYIYKDLKPTPMLSFAVRHFGATCGVMVTASHNPKEYNGYKAYWADGAQVTPPEDQIVIDAYNKIEDWTEIKTIDFEEAIQSGLIEYISNDVDELFYQNIQDQSINKEMCASDGEKVNIVFTSLHGTSLEPCRLMAKKMGFKNFHIVEEQASFDGNFPTVKSTPNPEDPIALEMAVDKLLKMNADVAFGTDPDCDRLGVVVNHKGVPHYLNGNQLSFLMLHYIFSEGSKKRLIPENPLVIKSVVTSELQTSIANKYGATVMNTLTGFKWMALLMRELEEKKSKYNFVFASEESFGYLPYAMVRDKDAVSAVVIMSEITLFYKLQNKTLIDALDEIYDIYGYAEESLIALTFMGLEGKEKINRIMNFYRENGAKAFASEKTVEINDLVKEPLNGHKSNVLGFVFESGNRVFLRPSGTEPKIKFYTMIKVEEGTLSEKKAIAKKAIEMIEKEIHQTVEKI